MPGNPWGNTVPVLLDENAPDGAVTKKSQIDNFMREERLALKTFLERSHVAFGEAKAGEMKQGTAALLVDDLAAAILVPADVENRIAYDKNTRRLMSWIDRGGATPAYEELAPVQSPPAEIETVAFQQTLTASYADLEASAGTPFQATMALAPLSSTGHTETVRVEVILTVHNTGGSAQAAAFKLRVATGTGGTPGAFADVNVAFGNQPASVRLGAGQAMQIKLQVEHQLAQHASLTMNTWWRIHAKGTNSSDLVVCSSSAFSGETPRMAMYATRRRRN